MKLSIKLSAPAKKEANGERQGGERNADDQGGDRPAKRIKVVLGAKRDHAQTAPKELELDELGQRELEQNEERALGNEPGTSGATAMSDEYHFPAWALRMGADSGHTGTQHGFRDMSSVDQINAAVVSKNSVMKEQTAVVNKVSVRIPIATLFAPL